MDPQLLTKLNKFLNAWDSKALTEQDFTNAFQKVVELVIKIQQEQQIAIKNLEETHKVLLNNMYDKHTSSLADLKKQVNGLFVSDQLNKMSVEQKQLFGVLKEEINKAVNQKLANLDNEIKQRAKPGLPGPKGAPGRPPTANEIELAFKPTMESFRIAWEEKVQQAMAQRGLGTGGGRQLRMSSFSFSGDGATTAFTLPKEPSAKGKAIWAFLNGQQIQLGVHYTIAKKTMNTTFIPQSGDTIEGYLINY